MRCSVHVDAGYLFASLATRETGSANRAAITVDVSALIKDLIAMAVADSGLRLLRVHWYDAARDGLPDPGQRQIGKIDSVKLRMGRINSFGEQKGVDLRLGLDLVGLRVNQAAEVAYVVSGDDDLTEAVTAAQDLGLQVKLIAVPDAGGHRPAQVAENLQLEVDGVLTIPAEVITRTVHRIGTRPTGTPAGSPAVGRVPAPKPSAAPLTTAGPEVIAANPGTGVGPVVPPQPVVPVARPAPVLPAARPVPVYSTSTGSTTTNTVNGGVAGVTPEMIEEVARSVFEVWVTTASQEVVSALKASRPNIPSDIDRILLIDMVNRAGVDDLPQSVRFDLRAAFWQAMEESLHS